MKKHGLLIVWGDVEPLPVRWYATPRARDLAAFRYRRKQGEEHGLYKVTLSAGCPQRRPVRLAILAYSGGEMRDGVAAPA